jgi:tetratricopeptide (TPR) repeat protein
MEEAIQSGYSEPPVFHLRARGHMISGNYGMAVKDIDMALANIDQQNTDQIVELLCHQAQALCNMGRFDEAYQVLSRARDFNEDNVRSHIMIGSGLAKRILCEPALKYKFYDHTIEGPMNIVVKILTLWGERSYSPDVSYSLYEIKKESPEIMEILTEILGEDLRYAMKNKSDLTVNVQLPKI